jgi:cytochrome bd-type quinol oxidase subunit 2
VRVISAFAAGFDIAAVLLAAATGLAFLLYDRNVGMRFRLAQAQVRLVLLGGAVFALVNGAAVVELLSEIGAGGGAAPAASVPVVQGAVAAVLAAALVWRRARRGAERDFDAELARLTER